MLLEKIVIEGIMPERALSKLQREGICVYHAKKLKKNQILLSVKKKDTEKVFAICPNVCYNVSVYSPYTAKRVGSEGLLAVLDWSKKRMGVLLGALLFLSCTLVANRFVFKIDVTGTDSYRREVLAALEESGIKTFAPYRREKEQEVCSKILALKDVSFCSVKKSGMTVRVEVRLNAFSEPEPQTGDMTAKHSGTILQAAVLRGTLLKGVGETVEAGEALVGAYFLSESGERTTATAIGRIAISCTYDEMVEAATEEEAFAAAYLSIDGEIAEKSCEAAEGGFRVRIIYVVTETINF